MKILDLEKKVKNTIEKYGMLSPKEKILVALSGGKDSAVAAYLIKKLGYKFATIHINLGIGNFSLSSEKAAKLQAEELGSEFYVLRIKEVLGRSIDEVKSKLPICSLCGLTRRYLLNYFAIKHEFDVVVTGHNLDDIAIFYLSNLLHGHYNYISTLKPVIPKEKNLVKKVKPLFFIREKDILKYAALNGIEYTSLICPYKFYASTQHYKLLLDLLDRVEKDSVRNLVVNLMKTFSYTSEERKECKICGMPSKGDVCSFCKGWQLKNRIEI